MNKNELSTNREVSRPHSDWQLNFSYYNRFDWPEHKLEWFEGIPTCAIFKTTQKQILEWPGGKQAVEIGYTTILDFHEPQELFKKKAISLSKVMNISIQEPKKHVYFAQDRVTSS